MLTVLNYMLTILKVCVVCMVQMVELCSCWAWSMADLHMFQLSWDLDLSSSATVHCRMLQPHMLMTEPIASRSHFSIQFDEEKQKFQAKNDGMAGRMADDMVFTGVEVGAPIPDDWVMVCFLFWIFRFLFKVHGSMVLDSRWPYLLPYITMFHD